MSTKDLLYAQSDTHGVHNLLAKDYNPEGMKKESADSMDLGAS